LVVVKGADSGSSFTHALQVLKGGGFSIDFLKLGKAQFSFIVEEGAQQQVVDALEEAGFPASYHRSKAVIRVSSPNVRDESGLMARIAQIILEAGATVYNVGDMHDCVMMVVQTERSQTTVDALREFVGRVDIL
ncbi:MAG: hypothetical protein H0W86_11815, partial [Armatimonadetes bacterium]|nr:hypothetical protein [Armatimonadota bacterium]